MSQRASIPQAPPSGGNGSAAAAAASSAPVRSGSASEPAEALHELLRTRGGERHAVVIQDFPDPDAISTALVYREIARPFGIDVDVLYRGTISHPQNLALVNLLRIELTACSEEGPLDHYDAAVFVDNQGTTSALTRRLQGAGVPTLAVIDHHDPQDVLDPIFADVRPVGAAATLATEYLRSGLFLRMDVDDPQHAQLATALMHGLHTETDGLLQAGTADLEAATYLSRFVDRDLLEQVMCVKKSRATMDSIAAALTRRTIRGGLAVAGVGFLRREDRDAIPQAADFLLTEANVHTAVVYGIVATEEGREVVSGSLRTGNIVFGVDSFLKKALGTDVRGKSYGGGRSRAGGFEIDVGFLSDCADRREREAKWMLYDRQIRARLFCAAGLGEEQEEEVFAGGAGGR